MEKQIITFSANEQCLQKTGGVDCYASNTVAYIEAHFDLGDNWSGYDSVRAVWFTDFVSGISTVLDSLGTCVVPYEVLTRKGEVKVNLVGSISNGEELTDRLTTCPVTAVTVKCNAKVAGANSTPITPSEYEQFVEAVRTDANRAEQSATASEQSAVNANASADEAEASAQNASESASASAISASDSARSATASAESAQNASESAQNAESARDKILSMRATASTLPAGSDATASYSDGLLSLGIPKGDTGATGAKGDKGDTGATPNLTIGTVSTLEPNTDATATITGTAEEPVLNLGIPKGEQGDVNLSQLEALLPTETASGEIVTITDGQAVVPVNSLKVALEPIQSSSGTPSPDNVRPISGRTEVVTQRTGKNLLDVADISTSVNFYYVQFGTDYELTADQTYTFSADITSNVEPFAISVGSGTDNYAVDIQTSSYNFNGKTSITFTPTATQLETHKKMFVRVPRYSTMQNITATIKNIQLELGTTATDYEPYDGDTYTTSLGQTVYGGVLDVVSGDLVVDRAMVTFDGTETWTAFGTGFLRVLSDMKIGRGMDGIANWLPTVDNSATFGAFFGAGNQVLYLPKITENISGVSDATTWSAYLANNPLQVAYPLATPQTIQLTPQEVQLLLGTNNVWSDGNVTLVYSADIQRYIEKKLNGNSTTSTLTMSRPMTAELNKTEETETETAETE